MDPGRQAGVKAGVAVAMVQKNDVLFILSFRFQFLPVRGTFAGTGNRAGNRRRRRAMKVRVDPEQCEGHSRCHALAPELFALDDFGNATVNPGGLTVR